MPERILSFYLASETDWHAANIAHATAQHMMVHGLIEGGMGATSYRLTDEGRAVLDVLLKL